jgi:hypothetical protein
MLVLGKSKCLTDYLLKTWQSGSIFNSRNDKPPRKGVLHMVKVIITGSGCPVIHRLDDVKACASEAILIGDDVLLFDFGRHVSSQLLRSGVPPYNVPFLHAYFPP